MDKYKAFCFKLIYNFESVANKWSKNDAKTCNVTDFGRLGIQRKNN